MSEISAKTILVLTANPKDGYRLRLDEEVREIDAGLQRAQKREQFILQQRWAVQSRDIQRAMLDINPQIVQFSGHGVEEQGLAIEDETGRAKYISGAALADLFELFSDQVECVLLNGCYSQVQAEAIARHIPYVIGMRQAIGDRAAIEFAVGFYDALGAGRSIEFAYRWGCNAIHMAGIPEHLTPVLLQRSMNEGSDNSIRGAPEQEAKNPDQASADALNSKTDPYKLSEGERRRLKVQLDELQVQFDDLTEEIQFLRQSEKTDELRPKEVLRLQRQIAQAVAARQTLTDKLSELERRLSP